MTASLHLAVAQAPAELASIQDRLDWLEQALPTLAGADLLVLPELFACGYNIAADVAQRAQAADGPIFRAIAKLAVTSGIAIHYGFAERSEGRIFNAARCVAPDGTVLCHQRKLALPPGFERAHFTPGRGCALFDYRGMTIATLICYDAEFPETVRHVASRGAQLVLVPTALGRDWSWVAQSMIPVRAWENGIYLAYANSAGHENGMAFLGGSVIAAPDGVELARAGDAPEILRATLHSARVRAAQDRLPYLTDRHDIRLE